MVAILSPRLLGMGNAEVVKEVASDGLRMMTLKMDPGYLQITKR